MQSPLDATNTPEELIDLVDEQDHIIGQTTKGEANRDPSKLHREVCVILIDNNNNILLQQRSFKKKVYPGYWIVSAAGHVPKGMIPLESIHKELQEELGFDTDIQFFKKELLHLQNETIFEYWHTATYSGQKIHPDADEVEQVKWVSEMDLDAMIKNGEKIEENCIRVMKEIWSKS